jgi:hypothetical protein
MASANNARGTFIVAFGCPFEGRVDPKLVLDLAGQLYTAGVFEPVAG